MDDPSILRNEGGYLLTSPGELSDPGEHHFLMFIIITIEKYCQPNCRRGDWVIPPRRVTWYTRAAMSALRGGTKKNQNREQWRERISPRRATANSAFEIHGCATQCAIEASIAQWQWQSSNTQYGKTKPNQKNTRGRSFFCCLSESAQ